MYLSLLDGDGVIQSTAQVADAIWNDAAGQAQITAWAQSKGFSLFPMNYDPGDAGTNVMSLSGAQTWIDQTAVTSQVGDAGSSGSSGSASNSVFWIAGGVALGLGALALWMWKRA